MSDDLPTTHRKKSFITGALQSVRGPAREALEGHDRALMLSMCYLWPLTCCGLFLPLIVYARFRGDDDLGLHARHGTVLAGIFGIFLMLVGALNGLVGRLSDDWGQVTVASALLVAIAAVTLAGLGSRWRASALRGEPVEIPWITELACRI